MKFPKSDKKKKKEKKKDHEEEEEEEEGGEIGGWGGRHEPDSPDPSRSSLTSCLAFFLSSLSCLSISFVVSSTLSPPPQQPILEKTNKNKETAKE